MPDRIKVSIAKEMIDRVRRGTAITIELAIWEMQGGTLHPTTLRKLKALDEVVRA